MHEVARGRWHGRLWRVLAEVGPDGRMTTQVRIGRGPLASWSSRTGQVVSEPGSITWWWEASSARPSFVVVQAPPEVRRVRVQAVDADDFDLVLNDMDSRTGLRFAAAPLRPGIAVVDVTPA